MKVDEAHTRKKELDKRVIEAVRVCKKNKSPITVIHFDKEDIQSLIRLRQRVNHLWWQTTVLPRNYDEKTRRIIEKQYYNMYHRCPRHEEIIKDYLYENFKYYLEKLESMNRYSGYIVHFHTTCPW